MRSSVVFFPYFIPISFHLLFKLSALCFFQGKVLLRYQTFHKSSKLPRIEGRGALGFWAKVSSLGKIKGVWHLREVYSQP